MNKYRYFILGILLSCFFAAYAKIKPQWINNVPTPGNSTYVFKVVETVGDDLASARAFVLKSLVSMIEHDDNIKIKENYDVNSERQQVNAKLTETKSKSIYTLEVENSVNKTITTEKVAEYWEDFEVHGQPRKRLYTLFMVQRKNHVANFNDIELTSKYGMQGFVRSMVVPGWGQIYKGSKVKAAFILGGTIAGAIGIVLTENTRADYIKKMHEQPKFADVYNSKATDWETARNVCIGATAALYVYNLIDALAADGAQRAIVKKHDSKFTFMPIISLEGGGFSLAYNF